jgi:hypothetical protein
MKRSREIAEATGDIDATALLDDPEDEDYPEDDLGGPVPLERTRHGRSSLDGWEADDSASDGLGDMYELGLRHNPRDTGERDRFTDQEERDLRGGD